MFNQDKIPKQKSYSITDILAVIASIKWSDETEANLSHDNVVPESTISRWLTDKERLCEFIHIVDSTDLMKKYCYDCQRHTGHVTWRFSPGW